MWEKVRKSLRFPISPVENIIVIHETLAYRIRSLCLLQLFPPEKKKKYENYLNLQVNKNNRVGNKPK